MTNLTIDERERIVDITLKLQSVRNSLQAVAAGKIPTSREMMECLRNVDENLRRMLGYT